MVSTSSEERSEYNTILSFWNEKCVFTNWDDGLLEKNMRQWKKMVSASHKISFHHQE